MKRVIFVSGPSGISKTKIKEKLENLAPAMGIVFERVIAFTSRKMRPNEAEGDPWFFRTAEQIKTMNAEDPDRFLKIVVREGEPQGVDAQTQIRAKLERVGVLWCELHFEWAGEIRRWLEKFMPDAALTTLFIAPLSESELALRAASEQTTPEKVIESEMHRRLLARRAAGLDNATDDNLRRRAADAIKAFAGRNAYDLVIVNHQGEESPDWGAPREFPTGEAARVFEQVLRVYRP